MKLKFIPLLILLIAVLSIFVSGCTDSGDSGNNKITEQEVEISGADEPITVAVSVAPQAEFVEKVGGNRVKTVVIVPAGADPHTYEPSPKEVQEISKARVLVTVGVEMPFEEGWISNFKSMNSGTLIVNCSKGIELKKLEGHQHHEGEGEEDDEELDNEHENESDADHKELDPHIWTSTANAKIMVEDIYEGLSEIDPENEAYYAQNRDAYLEELDALDKRIREKLKGSEGNNFMVYHPSWGYFASEYGLNMISVEIEGKEPSAQDLKKLVDLAKEKNVKVIFVQANFSTRSAEVLAEEIGGKVVAVDPLAKDYIANMDNVSDVFARNLV
ncbi:MAG: zinc ABC transporter substrate-binding protein [Euryarchaeota archaeon]|nr:zinc ABC transporter substrate-binding protein [Euryarchaeota archaeon]